jgi:hypothetical protein
MKDKFQYTEFLKKKNQINFTDWKQIQICYHEYILQNMKNRGDWKQYYSKKFFNFLRYSVVDKIELYLCSRFLSESRLNIHEEGNPQANKSQKFIFILLWITPDDWVFIQMREIAVNLN